MSKPSGWWKSALARMEAPKIVSERRFACTFERPPGLDSIHFNPAGLSKIDKNLRSDSIFGASLRISADFHQPEGFDIGGWTEDPLNGTVSDHNKQTIYIPIYGQDTKPLPIAFAAALAFSYHNEGSPWTFATGTYVPQAYGIDRSENPNDPARYDGKRVVMQRLVYLSPSVSYKFSDQFSLGLAVPIAHQASCSLPMMPSSLFGKRMSVSSWNAWCAIGMARPRLNWSLNL